MKSEKMIIQIIKRTGLSRDEIYKMMKEKQVKLKKTFSDIHALFMVAEELAVSMED